jgi:hypothetical protein
MMVGIATAAAGLAALVPGATLLGLDGKITTSGCGAKKCIYDTASEGGVLTGLGVAALLTGGAILVWALLKRGPETQEAPGGGPTRGAALRLAVTPLAGGGWVQVEGRF